MCTNESPQSVFLQRIENNWRTGRHALQRIHCRSETSKGVYCLQYDDDKIISGLRDNTIKVRVRFLLGKSACFVWTRVCNGRLEVQRWWLFCFLIVDL